jgi:hypothetical protein
MPEALATVDELRLFLGDPVDYDHDVAELYLRLASDEVRAATGRSFDAVTSTVDVDGSGTAALLLPDPPVTDVISVVADPLGAADTIAPAAYEWSRTGILRLLPGWGFFARRYGFYRVTYAHGFAEIPGVVTEVVLRMAARTMSNPEGLKQEALGRYSFTRAGETGGIGLLPADFAALGELLLPGATRARLT